MTKKETDTATEAELTINVDTRLLRDHEVAQILGVSIESLQSGRVGRGELVSLPWFRVGKSVRYSIDDVKGWLLTRRMGV